MVQAWTGTDHVDLRTNKIINMDLDVILSESMFILLVIATLVDE